MLTAIQSFLSMLGAAAVLTLTFVICADLRRHLDRYRALMVANRRKRPDE